MGFLSALFGKKDKNEDNWEDQLVWFSASDEKNPFNVDVLDCRAVALGFLSATKDKDIAERFTFLRTDDGARHIDNLPEDYMVIDCDLVFPFNGEHNDGAIFRAGEMEDKWDFSIFQNKLYISRSWTGVLLHVADVEFTNSQVLVKRIYSNRAAVYEDSDFATENMFFLITTHLGGKIIPFPIAQGMRSEERKFIAVTGFNNYGRRAQFASYNTKENRAID